MPLSARRDRNTGRQPPRIGQVQGDSQTCAQSGGGWRLDTAPSPSHDNRVPRRTTVGFRRAIRSTPVGRGHGRRRRRARRRCQDPGGGAREYRFVHRRRAPSTFGLVSPRASRSRRARATTASSIYRMALAPLNFHHTAYGIRMDTLSRFERIAYPALAWLVAGGRSAFVPWSLVIVNVDRFGAVWVHWAPSSPETAVDTRAGGSCSRATSGSCGSCPAILPRS